MINPFNSSVYKKQVISFNFKKQPADFVLSREKGHLSEMIAVSFAQSKDV